jgi:hypothetical protein
VPPAISRDLSGSDGKICVRTVALAILAGRSTRPMPAASTAGGVFGPGWF